MKPVNYKFIMPFFLPVIKKAQPGLYVVFCINAIVMLIAYIFSFQPWGLILLIVHGFLMCIIWLVERQPLHPLDYVLKRYIQFNGKIEILEQSTTITLYQVALFTEEKLNLPHQQKWYLILGKHQGFSVLHQRLVGDVTNSYKTENPRLKKILAPLDQLTLRAFAHSPILIDVGIQAISHQNEALILFFQHLEYTDANNVSHVLRYQHIKQHYTSRNQHHNHYDVQLRFKNKEIKFELKPEEMEFLRYVLSENDQYLIG